MNCLKVQPAKGLYLFRMNLSLRCYAAKFIIKLNYIFLILFCSVIPSSEILITTYSQEPTSTIS